MGGDLSWEDAPCGGSDRGAEKGNHVTAGSGGGAKLDQVGGLGLGLGAGPLAGGVVSWWVGLRQVKVAS